MESSVNSRRPSVFVSALKRLRNYLVIILFAIKILRIYIIIFERCKKLSINIALYLGGTIFHINM